MILFLTPTLRRRLAGRDRTAGVAAVEAAIVLPVVLAVFVAIFEFGLIFKDSLAISAGVRAGGRLASAEPLKLSFARDAAKQVADAMTTVNTTGTATLWVFDPSQTSDPSGGCPSRCVSFVWSESAQKFGTQNGFWNPCILDATRVGIMLKVQHKGITSVSYASPTLVEKAVFAFEPTATTAVCQ